MNRTPTIRKLREFYTCGFVIYRCAYSDDDLWSRMIEKIRTETLERLDKCGRAELLGPLISWTVIEDREALDNASIKKVQERFLKWAEDVSDERDGPGAVKAAFMCPRYNFCVMIDQKCLDSLAAHEKEAAAVAAAGQQRLLRGNSLPVFVIFIRIEKPMPAWMLAEQASEQASWRLASTTLVDSSSQVQTDDTGEDQVEDGEDVDEEVFEDEDENEEWMYVETYLLMSMYETCHSPSSYWNYYVRQPQIYARGEVKWTGMAYP